jgi:hypothetical protein
MWTLARVVSRWLVIAVVVTGLSGLVYLAVQQNYRMNANDPQIQMAEDAVAALASGQAPEAVAPKGPVDIANSLAPWLAVYDDGGQALASSGQFRGQAPVLPRGVFDYARSRGQDRLTWQPELGVRQAVVVARYSGARASGFVVAGRSLREAEKRVDQLTLIVGLGWLATLAAATLFVALGEWTAKKS